MGVLHSYKSDVIYINMYKKYIYIYVFMKTANRELLKHVSLKRRWVGCLSSDFVWIYVNLFIIVYIWSLLKFKLFLFNLYSIFQEWPALMMKSDELRNVNKVLWKPRHLLVNGYPSLYLNFAMVKKGELSEAWKSLF